MHQNSLPEQTENSLDSSLQDVFQQVETIDNKHNLVNVLNQLEHALSTPKKTSSDTFTSILSKLLRRVFTQRIFQLNLHKDASIKSKLLNILNNEAIPRILLYQVILQTLDYLESSPFTEIKLEIERKTWFEEILLAVLLDQENFVKLCKELFEVDISNEFSEILRTVFKFPVRVANYLEGCPPPLKNETFFLRMLQISLEEEDSVKKKKEQYYSQFINSLLINGQTGRFLQSNSIFLHID